MKCAGAGALMDAMIIPLHTLKGGLTGSILYNRGANYVRTCMYNGLLIIFVDWVIKGQGFEGVSYELERLV